METTSTILNPSWRKQISRQIGPRLQTAEPDSDRELEAMIEKSRQIVEANRLKRDASNAKQA